jgi:hypothetical protein
MVLRHSAVAHSAVAQHYRGIFLNVGMDENYLINENYKAYTYK